MSPNGTIVTSNYAAADQGTRILSWRGQVTLPGITDGTSNTLLIGEKHLPPAQIADPRRPGPQRLRPDPQRLPAERRGRHPGRRRRAPPRSSATRNPGPLANERFGSWHPGVCQFAMCDGSVRALKNSIQDVLNPNATPIDAPANLGPLHRLSVRNDGLVISGDN